MNISEKDCFGFYMGNPVCNRCPPRQRCKAILISNGFDIVGGAVELMIQELPDGKAYYETDRIPTMVDQLMYPPVDAHQDEIDAENELLDLLERDEISKEEVDELSSGDLLGTAGRAPIDLS